MVSYRGIFLGFMLAVSLGTGDRSAQAGGGAPIAGEYLCASGCRLTDAPPSIEIDGSTAHCMNEFGGTYVGKLLTERSVSCFNKTGILSDDGTTILWSNGAIWKRRSGP